MNPIKTTLVGVKNEIILYSGQYALFYIIMNFCKDRFGYFSDLGHVLLIFVLIIQTIFLVRFGSHVVGRIIGSLIAPLMYTIIEFKLDFEFILNSAHIFFWIFSICAGIAQAMQIKTKNIVMKKINEAIITSLNILMFLFIYFYFDLYASSQDMLRNGSLTQLGFNRQLNIANLFANIATFLSDPTHAYIIVGGILLTASIAIGRIEVLKLNEKIKALFGKYVDKNIRDKILSDGIGRSENKELCILFSDIRNFSATSESNSPQSITKMLNIYFSKWADTANKYNGIIDKYIGDAVMIVFENKNGGLSCKNAVLCGVEMLSKMNGLNEELGNDHLPLIEGIGIGIHFGHVIAGDIGSTDRVNYTYIGDNVNVASRLETLTKQIKKRILISQDVFDLLSSKLKCYFTRVGQEILLKGKKNHVGIYYFNDS